MNISAWRPARRSLVPRMILSGREERIFQAAGKRAEGPARNRCPRKADCKVVDAAVRGVRTRYITQSRYELLVRGAISDTSAEVPAKGCGPFCKTFSLFSQATLLKSSDLADDIIRQARVDR